jgi:hypothetical protein
VPQGLRPGLRLFAWWLVRRLARQLLARQLALLRRRWRTLQQAVLADRPLGWLAQ